MSLTLKDAIKLLCRQYEILPQRSRGQNFLVNENVYKEIIRHAELTKDDVVLEVGPGFGTLTAFLAEKAKRVIAVELDKKLVDALRAQLIGFDNVEIFHGDILKLQAHLPKGDKLQADYKIVANLPYNITSHFLRKFLTLSFPPHPTFGHPHKPSLMVLLLQKEVAERICAKPGDMSLLSFSVQFYADPKIIEYVPKENFWPLPKVNSAIIKIIPHKKEKIDIFLKKATVGEKGLFSIVRWGFASKRKQLHNNISSGLYSTFHRKATSEELDNIFQKSRIHPQRRAQDLSIQDWLNLAESIYEILGV